MACSVVKVLAVSSVLALATTCDAFMTAPSLRPATSALRAAGSRQGRCSTVAPSMVLTPDRRTASAPTGFGDQASQPPSKEESNSRPPIGIWDLLTKYAYGQQNPDIALPIVVEEGQAPEHFPGITAEHLRTLEEDGVVHIPGVLNEEWINYLRDVTEWQIKNPHIWSVPGVVSGLYDYIQRSAWTTNDGFAKFLYYSPVSSVLGQMASCGWFPEGDARGHHEVRISTDLLMVNPNKGFKWHQDNQNGPLVSGHGGPLDALRFWVTMDDTPADYGAPVYLRKSHLNKCVGKDDVFINIEEGDIPQYASDLLEFRPKAGDMIIWHPRSIHKIDGAPNGWGKSKRRVLGGTVAIDDAKYQGKKKAMFSDMGGHTLSHGDPLVSPFFPIVYPKSDAAERKSRARGEVGRSVEGFGRMVNSLFNVENVVQFSSWSKVLSNARKIQQTNEPFIGKDK